MTYKTMSFRVDDGQDVETKMDCLQDAVKYCDKYDLPYDLIIRLENGVQVSAYGSYGIQDGEVGIVRLLTPFSFTEAERESQEKWNWGVGVTNIKFRVADGKCSTVKTLDTLEEAIEFCDKYYLPYGLIIRLENGVQVSDYGEYEYGEEREETARASAEWFDKGFTMGWNMDNINLPSKELLEECWVERHGALPLNNPEGQRDCLQEGMDSVSKALGIPYKTVRFMELRNRTVIMCMEK